MGFADGDWFVATVMEGMEEEQELDPLSAKKGNVDKLLSAETIKTASAVKNLCVYTS